MLKTRLVRYGAIVLLALGAFVAGVWLRGPAQTQMPSAAAAQAIYALKLPDLKGRPQALNQWRGKVMVVNFWATWCAPCREEIPEFVKTQEKYSANGLQIVGISIDQADKTSEFSATFKINYPVLIGTFDTIEVSQRAGNERRVLPYTVVLDRQGEIAATALGGLTAQKLDAVLKPLL